MLRVYITFSLLLTIWLRESILILIECFSKELVSSWLQVFSDENNRPSMKWGCTDLQGETMAESCRWVSNIKISVLLKKGWCQSILETRRLSHLHGSAPFTVPLKLSESHKNATYLLKNSVSLFFITEISNWVKDGTTKKMKEHENYTLLLDEATVGPNFLLLPLL